MKRVEKIMEHIKGVMDKVREHVDVLMDKSVLIAVSIST